MNIINKIKKHFTLDIGIDLGTANTLVYVRGEGIVASEPSVVAVVNGNREVMAVGMEAKKMLGRTPGSISATRPMKDGVIAEFDVAEAMLRYFIEQASKQRRIKIWRPRVLIAVPSGITEVETRAVNESAIHAGAQEVHLVEEPMAAAIGSGLKVGEPVGNMIVDIGGGTTEVAIISLADTVVCRSLKCGGDAMDQAIIQHLKRSHKLLIGERTAEKIKENIGSAYKLEQEEVMEVKGRDLEGKQLPRSVEVTSEEIREALRVPVNRIVEAVNAALEVCPPELSGDLMDHGIMLAGGGAQLRGLDDRFKEETNLPVTVAENPLLAVANGTGVVLDDFETFIKTKAIYSSTKRARK